MARSLFGGRVGDTVASLYNLGNRQVFTLPVDANGDPSSVTLQVWDAVDGTQLTDLLAADGTTPITTVTVPSTGQVPEFYGPDGVNVAVYVKDPDDDFYRLDARADDAAQVAADAAAAAEAAATAAEAVGNTNDTIIAGRINDPASATASALSASTTALGDDRYQRLGASINDLPKPLWIGHRSGAGAGIGPEGTKAAKNLGIALGLVNDIGDFRRSADNVLYDMHDTTLDRVTNLTGNLSSASVFTLLSGRNDAPDWFGSPVWSQEPIYSANELVAEYGFYPYLLECKGPLADYTEMAQIVAASGSQRRCLASGDSLDGLEEFVAVGAEALWYAGDGTTVLSQSPSLLDRGVNWVGVKWDVVSVATVNSLIAAGLNVVLYTLERHFQLDKFSGITGEFAGFLCDQPIYLRDHYENTYTYRRATDPFALKTPYHGIVGQGTETATALERGEFFSDGTYGSATASAPSRFILQGWGCPLAATTTVEHSVDIKFQALASDTTRYPMLLIGSPKDPAVNAGNPAATALGGELENGYRIVQRQNGELRIDKVTAGVLSNIGLVATTPVTVAGTTVTLKTGWTSTATYVYRSDTPVATLSSDLSSGVAVTSLPINALGTALASGAKVRLPTGQYATLTAGASAGATSLTVSSITPSSAVASGAALQGAVQVADTTHRGGYFYFGWAQEGGAAALRVRPSNWTVTAA